MSSGGTFLRAQDSLPPVNKKPVDVNFIFNYYVQDGEHSAVTGGIGTQSLADRASVITVNIPVDSTGRIGFTQAVNYYSSASTDNIDFKVSSASRDDLHWQMQVDYEKERLGKDHSYSISAGAGSESDYISSSIGAGWSKWTKDKNHYFDLNLKAYFDTWVLIFPEELRQTAHRDISTDKRKTILLSSSYSRVINKRMKGSVFFEAVYQTGLLSTPFHRVYFADTDAARIEKFPSSRFKLPIGFRLNTFIGNSLVLRLYDRFYWDNFGILANAFTIEPVLKLSNSFSIYPFYRFYFQTASDYFAPYAEHLSSDEFYTSDYDLSGFYSHKGGFGLRISPVWYNTFKNRRRAFRSFTLRYSLYSRSDGLKSGNVNMGFSFAF